jgi:DNA-binding transcriptional LysR family regulator
MGHVDMNAAVVLVQVAHSGSFRGAALILGMPKSSVSRKVAELEARLGVQLLRRSTRHVALTDAGVAYVEAAQAAVAHLEAAEQAVSHQQREPQGRIRITAPAPLAHTVLTSLLAEFLQRYPKVEIQLQLSYRVVDLLAERFDIALRYGALPDSSLVAVALGNAGHRIVASPGYLAAHGTPQTPAELALHSCLLFGADGASLRTTWPLMAGKRPIGVAVRGPFATDDRLALRAAALGGLGLAHLPEPMVADDIACGALVPVLTTFTTTTTPFHLVHAGERHLPARTRALIDFLVERLSAPQAGDARPSATTGPAAQPAASGSPPATSSP